ncbi:hypothetical protein [Actinomadura sp. 21ATH]|uniref:hypothetical protein n=1 Tax=Actinomadura sp. 21ATH TaxID=1735444 RepID=UPI0035C188BE
MRDTPHVLDQVRPELEQRRDVFGPVDRLHAEVRRQLPTVRARPIEYSPMHELWPVRELPQRWLEVRYGPTGPFGVAPDGDAYLWRDGPEAGRSLGRLDDLPTVLDSIARLLGTPGTAS